MILYLAVVLVFPPVKIQLPVRLEALVFQFAVLL
jgi:hypothetical protein